VSLTLTWPLRLCLLRVLLDTTTTATIFPISKHTGGCDTAPAFSGLCVYLQFTWEVGLPPLLWSFPPTAAFTSFPSPRLLGGCRHSCLLWPGLFIYSSMRDCPYLPLQHSGSPALFATCLFCCCYCLFSIFSLFFPWVGVGLSRELC
jgi:hypothetical protein